MSHQTEREVVVSKSNLENSENARHRFDDVKKELENSAACDSGYLSAPNITCSLSDIGHSSSDIGITDDSHTKFTETLSTEQKKTNTSTFDPSGDSGVIVDTREDDSNYHSQQSIEHENSNPKMFINSNSGLEEWFCELSLDQSNKLDGKKSKRLSYDELIELIFSQDDDGDTQLHISIITEDSELSVAIIRMAPQPNLLDIRNDDAQTPIHLAALTGQSQIVRRLLVAGAEASVRDREGNTALHLACQRGDLSVVESLTRPINVNEIANMFPTAKGGAKQMYPCGRCPDIEQKNYLGENCVHIAAEKNQIEILKYLCCIGADINAREGRSGYTPLHIAVQNDNTIMVDCLLKECKRINVETRTYGRLTAYQLACDLDRTEIMKMLEKFGCEMLSPPTSDYDDSEDDSDFDDTDDSNKAGHSSGIDD